MAAIQPPLGRVTASPVAEAVARASILPLTIEQYLRMIDEKIIPEDAATELLRGVVIRKNRSSPGEDPMAHGPRHRMVVSLLTALTVKINRVGQHLQIQLPVACPPDGAPEPDGSVVRGSPRDYAERMPGPGDVTCVIEAAHSSLDRDREDKLPVYAAAGMPQYVIINLAHDTVEVYTDPDPSGEQYRTKATLERGDTLTLELPEGALEVPVTDVLP